MNLLYLLPRPVIFAHRGASAHAPENTLAAFELALVRGADAIELDVMLSADEHVVVTHDNTVDRTTDGYGAVRNLLFSTLSELNAGKLWGNQFVNERIPSLEEVFATLGKRTLLNIELKNYITPHDALPDKVAEMVKWHGLQDRVIFSSFLQLNLIRIRKILPDTPVALLAMPGVKGIVARSFIGRRVSPWILHPYYSDVNEEWLAREQAFGRRIHVWTVNDAASIGRLAEMGVDGIITDDPLGARHALEMP